VQSDEPCPGCGEAFRREGPVVNFLGAGAFLTPARKDVAMAHWLLEHRSAFDPLWSQTGPVDFAQLADAAVSAQDIERMVSGTTFVQILNDCKRIIDGMPAPSPTVEFMRAKSDINANSVVLDIGCSDGRHLWEIASRGPRLMAGADIQLFPLAVGALAWQTQNVPVQPSWCAASILSLPFKDRAFSHVHCFGTLSVVPVHTAVAELKRVLADDGQLMVTVEGMGYWQRNRDRCAFFSRERVNLLRRWLGERLLRVGVNWQEIPGLRRLSGHTQYTRPTLERIFRRAGLRIEAFEVLNEYNGLPLLYGITMRKR
jgi:SAM-dependent methyltransferase